MKIIAVSGAHGFVGTALKKALNARGYEVWPLVRTSPAKEHEIFYDVEKMIIERKKLAKCDAVINLAGKNIMAQPWTASFKAELRESRLKTTSLIAAALAELNEGPKVLLSASAFGFYGDSGNQEIDEHGAAGEGFLARLCQDWEHASLPAKAAGVRVVTMRFGLVMGREGGMYKNLRPAFKLGMGPMFGSGKQYMPIVDIDDAVAAIIFALEHQNIQGPINVVSPQVATNEALAMAIARAFKHRAWLHIPAWSLELLGDLGRMMLVSCRAVPHVLLAQGFSFSYPNAREIVRHLEESSN